MRLRVFVRFRFEAWHCWPEAPEEHAYLRARHRHEFHVEAHRDIYHMDREVEFIKMKREMLTACVEQAKDVSSETWSCERWCLWLLSKFPGVNYVEVSEDGENGSGLER